MAASVEQIKRLETVTDCVICAGDLTDARVLPCLHTFCLKCIDKWNQNKAPEEKISCPICRQEFELSEGGTADLPKNCFVEKLLEVKKLSGTLSQGDLACDVCCDDEEEPEKKKTKKATVYCVECRHNMCEQCCRCQQKFRLPGEHKLIELNREMNADELLLKFPENTCDRHSDKSLEIYCFDCKAAVCMMCYITSHNSHKCSDIKQVAEELGKQMSANTENLAVKVTDCETVLKDIEENEEKFCNRVAETEKMICKRAEKMKQLIEDQKQELLEQLSVSKDKQLKQTAIVREEIERHQIVLENFIRYSNEVKQKGTACDIAKLASELNARSEELQKFDIETNIDYDVTEVHFTSVEADDDLKKVFGNLAVDVQGYFKVSGQVMHTIPNLRGIVTGIAVLNEHLYVSHLGSSQIAVYSPTTFQYQNYLNVYHCGYQSAALGCRCLGGSYGSQIRSMTACNTNNCIYASDQYSHYIFKVALSQNNSLSYWFVGGNPQGLSLTASHNLLVALLEANALREYSPDQALIREINVQPAGISSPIHAVQLSNDHYAVTHGPAHQFSVINSDGQLVQSYRGNAGNMNGPRAIADYKRDRVFVADQNSNRILVIGSKTLSAYPLQLADCQLNGPYSLHYDIANSRLFIGEWNGFRIHCCKIP